MGQKTWFLSTEKMRHLYIYWWHLVALKILQWPSSLGLRVNFLRVQILLSWAFIQVEVAPSSAVRIKIGSVAISALFNCRRNHLVLCLNCRHFFTTCKDGRCISDTILSFRWRFLLPYMSRSFSDSCEDSSLWSCVLQEVLPDGHERRGSLSALSWENLSPRGRHPSESHQHWRRYEDMLRLLQVLWATGEVLPNEAALHDLLEIPGGIRLSYKAVASSLTQPFIRQQSVVWMPRVHATQLGQERFSGSFQPRTQLPSSYIGMSHLCFYALGRTEYRKEKSSGPSKQKTPFWLWRLYESPSGWTCPFWSCSGRVLLDQLLKLHIIFRLSNLQWNLGVKGLYLVGEKECIGTLRTKTCELQGLHVVWVKCIAFFLISPWCINVPWLQLVLISTLSTDCLLTDSIKLTCLHFRKDSHFPGP